MNISIKLAIPQMAKRILALILAFALLSVTGPGNLFAYQDQAPPTPQAAPPTGAPPQGPAPAYAPQNPQQIQQLVAPIALYPDSLVAQILAASTYPEQIVQADRWVQAHPDLKGDDLAKGVDQQPWDPSVKALCAFPSVIGNMDKNLSWTSSLGDAYYNQQQDVMDAVQFMRHKAQQAGALKSTPQQTVTAQGSDVEIQPVDPNVVYVPAYDPWLIYGYPLTPWPYWYDYPGIWYGGPYLSWGIGFPIGFFFGFGWGWGRWGFDWGHRWAVFNGGRYYSRSSTFYNRNGFYGRGGAARNNVVGARPGGAVGNRAGVGGNRGGVAARPFNGNPQAARGFGAPQGQAGMHSGAFSGFGQGGQARGFASRGGASFGGGGFGGGGARGGGGFSGGGAARGGGGGGRR